RDTGLPQHTRTTLVHSIYEGQGERPQITGLMRVARHVTARTFRRKQKTNFHCRQNQQNRHSQATTNPSRKGAMASSKSLVSATTSLCRTMVPPRSRMHRYIVLACKPTTQ